MLKFKELFKYFSKEVWPATVANVVGNDNVQRLTCRVFCMILKEICFPKQ